MGLEFQKQFFTTTLPLKVKTLGEYMEGKQDYAVCSLHPTNVANWHAKQQEAWSGAVSPRTVIFNRTFP